MRAVTQRSIRDDECPHPREEYNGKLQWEKDLVSEYNGTKPHYGFAGSPVIEGDLLILIANTAGIALDKKTGNKVWDRSKPPKKIRAYWANVTTGTDYSTPVMWEYEEKRYAILSSYEGIHSVEVETGKVLWFFEWELYSGNNIADPFIFNNNVFIPEFLDVASRMKNFTGMTGCVLIDIEGAEPKVIWKNQNLGSEISSPVMIGCSREDSLRSNKSDIRLTYLAPRIRLLGYFF